MSSSLQWAHPWVWLSLFLLPAYVAMRIRVLRRGRVVFPPLQTHPGIHRGGLASGLRWIVEIALLVVLVAGLAGPYRSQRLDLIEDEGIDVVLVLDVSLSMMAEDFPPNRLETLRRIASDFVRRSGGHRIGLVIFAKDTFVQSPLTTDRPVLFSLLDSVTIRTLDQAKSGGTAIGDALLVAADLLERARIDGRDQAVVLLTDGESNEGADPLLAADYLRHLEIETYAVGIGGREKVEVWVDGERLGGETPYLAELDDGQLLAVTERAQGRYWRAEDVGALEEIFGELSRLQSAPLEVRQLETHEGYGHLFALAGLPCFALYLFFGGQVLRRPFR